MKYSPTKYIDTTERGLVVVSVNEGDAGRYDCYLGGSLLCSYSITVDAHRWVLGEWEWGNGIIYWEWLRQL